MTPRERAEALFRLLDRQRGLSDDECVALIAMAITEHVRALLADDEATIEMMVRAHSPRRWESIDKMRPETKYEQILIDADFVAMRAALAALRIKAGA